MKNQVKVTYGIEVPHLMNYVDTELILNELNNYACKLSEKINISDVDDWNILIFVTMRASDKIGAYKKSNRYPSDKEYTISISIPIPNETQATYGLKEVRLLSYYNPINDKNFHLLEPNYDEYDCLYDYVLTSSKKAIELLFKEGITCNGKRIKIQP